MKQSNINKIQLMCPGGLQDSRSVKECTLGIFVNVITEVQIKILYAFTEGWSHPSGTWIRGFRGRGCLFCKSQNEYAVRRNGQGASDKWCLFGGWGAVLCLLKIKSYRRKMEKGLGANSSAWHTWFVQRWEQEDDIWLMCRIYECHAAQTGLE